MVFAEREFRAGVNGMGHLKQRIGEFVDTVNDGLVHRFHGVAFFLFGAVPIMHKSTLGMVPGRMGLGRRCQPISSAIHKLTKRPAQLRPIANFAEHLLNVTGEIQA